MLYIAAALRRATFDKFGEEGLKAGVAIADGGIYIYIYICTAVHAVYICVYLCLNNVFLFL